MRIGTATSEDQQALIVMMDSLVKETHMTKVMGKTATR